MDMFLYQIRRGVAKSIGIAVVGKAINVLLEPLQMIIMLIIGRNPIIMRICRITLTALPKRAQKYQKTQFYLVQYVEYLSENLRSNFIFVISLARPETDFFTIEMIEKVSPIHSVHSVYLITIILQSL